MTTSEHFFDTNVVLYALSEDTEFFEPSLRLLRSGGTISVQVLNECAHTLRRKFSTPWPRIKTASEQLREMCAVEPLTAETHVRGLAFAERYQLNVYDGMIVAAAVIAGCKTLYSEDMRDGLIIEGLTIRNPYTAAGG